MILHHGSFLIRKSTDQCLFAAPRGLSQLVTSFFGSWCQGIHLALLFAWTFELSFRFSELLEFLKHGYLSQQKGFVTFLHFYFSVLRQNCVFTLWLERPDLFAKIRLCPLYLFFVLNFFALFDFQWTWNHFSKTQGASAFVLKWWRWWESNPWPPACRAGALPAELHPHPGIQFPFGHWKLNNNLRRTPPWTFSHSSKVLFWSISKLRKTR